MSSSRSPSRQRRSSRSRKSSRERRPRPDKEQSKDERRQELRCTFSRRIFDPSIVPNLEALFEEQSPISFDGKEQAPWTLRWSSENQNDAASTNPVDLSEMVGAFPPWNYLELRRKQHTLWATQRLEQGVEFAKKGKTSEAEARYKEGLNLAPSHAPLLVAYGALCANLDRTHEAIAMLKEALKIDPECPNAQVFLDKIQKRTSQPLVPPRVSASVHRSDAAMKDALTERSFLIDDPLDSQLASNGAVEEYPLVYEETPVLTKDDKIEKRDTDASVDGRSIDSDSRSSFRKHRRRKHHLRGKSRDRHRKSLSRRKQKKTKRDRSASRSDENIESDEERYKRKRHKTRKRRQSSSHDDRRHRRHHRRRRSRAGREEESDLDSSHARRKPRHSKNRNGSGRFQDDSRPFSSTSSHENHSQKDIRSTVRTAPHGHEEKKST